MRPLSSDQADRIPSPYTVDAGHVQVETELVNYFYANRSERLFTDTYTRVTELFTWNPCIKIGLCKSADFEVQVSSFSKSFHDSISTAGGTYYLSGLQSYGLHTAPGSYPTMFTNSPTRYDFRASSTGFGAVSPKFKINLWGNDGGPTSLAIIPFLHIPVNGNSDVNGGLAIPFAIRLPKGFSLKLDSEAFSVSGFGQREAGFQNSVSITKTLNRRFEVFANFSSYVTTRPLSEWGGYAGFGGTYNFTRNFQAYAGMRFGLTSNAYDYNPYFGVVVRF